MGHFKVFIELSQYCFCLISDFFGHEACGILPPWPGIEPASPALKGNVSTSGPPEKSPHLSFESEDIRSWRATYHLYYYYNHHHYHHPRHHNWQRRGEESGHPNAEPEWDRFIRQVKCKNEEPQASLGGNLPRKTNFRHGKANQKWCFQHQK